MKIKTEKSFTRITLALDIVRKIAIGPLGGYHELSIIKHRIGLYDTITVEEASSTRIACRDPRVPCDGRNICLRALEAIKTTFGIDKNVTITIEKNIPVMGGLAGGSANAATTIRLLDSLWELGLDKKQMMDIGRPLGMDVPYFFSENTAFDTEAGGVLEPISTSCCFNFLLVIPDFGVSTKEAYADIDYSLINKNIAATTTMRQALIRNDPDAVIRNMHNDFELSVFRRYPELELITERLLELGCKNAALTGSGSTVIGIAGSDADMELIGKKIGHKTITVKSLY
jgi:4-diphosphocytidyl-2-C-methyl-D-erythritol kinase